MTQLLRVLTLAAAAAASDVATLDSVAIAADAAQVPLLGGVALQLRELEDMRARGTLNDQTFAHAVHEATVLSPLVSSLSAMGVRGRAGKNKSARMQVLGARRGAARRCCTTRAS